MRKAKTIILAVAVAGIMLGVFSAGACAQVPAKKGEFAVGMESLLPVTGISGKYWLSDKWAAQGIIGLFGTVNMYGGRAVYKFKEGKNHYLYGAGTVGVWTYDYGYDTESAFGFGLSGGIEYFPDFVPQLGFSLEIGLSVVDLEHYNYNTMSFGGGVHYYF